MKLTTILHENDEFAFDITPNNGNQPQPVPAANIVPAAIAPQDPADKVTLDVPLLIRLLEWAKEDAKDDMQLHKVSEKLITLSKNEQPLTMQNYDEIVNSDANNVALDIKKA